MEMAGRQIFHPPRGHKFKPSAMKGVRRMNPCQQAIKALQSQL